jgi:hypothetical protein
MGGSITIDEIKDNVPNYTDYKVFVETGTYKGETIREMAQHFDELYTFEIHPELYQYSLSQNTSPKINYLFGDSVALLPKTISVHNLNGKKCMFFLDAHISGHDSGFNPAHQVPLLEEIDIISSGIKSACVLCLDDARFFAQEAGKPWDWSHISIDRIKSIIGAERIDKLFVNNDRVWVVLNATES